MSNDQSLLPRLVSSAALIVLAIATVYWSQEHWYLCLVVCCAVVALGLWEMMGLLKAKGIKVFELYTMTGGVALIAAVFFANFPRNISGDLVLWVFYGWCLGLFFLMAAQPQVEGAMGSFFGAIGSVLYVAVLFGFLIKIVYLEGIDGRWFVFYTFITVFAADMAAYAVGSLVGKKPLAAIISPKKTVEGAMGALLGACAASLLAQRWMLPQLNVLHAVALGFLVGVVSQIGDLWESLLKRDAQVKDSGRSIPGMGGVLDLLDGLLFCAPLVFLYMKIVLRL